MKLKTYRAATMADALAQVKKELGKDAVILHTRTVKVGGVLGMGRKTQVEITAADEPTPGTQRAPKAPRRDAPAKADPRSQPTAQSPASGGTGVSPVFSPEALAAYRKAATSSCVSSAPLAPTPANTPQPALRPTSPPAPVPEPTILPVRERRLAQTPESVPARVAEHAPIRAQNVAPIPDAASIQRDLHDIKLLVNQVLHASPASAIGVASGAMPDALFRHYLRLLESAVSRDLADQIVGAVRDELTPHEMHDESIVRSTVLRHLAALIPVAEAPLPARAQRGHGGGGGGVSGPLVIALVGPTGVGKTTTIAKLAAAYKLRQGRSVALITSDTYRIAAVDQLRTYAGIIGLPLKVVLSPSEMSDAVRALSAHDVILIDTAGRSQFNTDRLEELRDFLAAASPNEVHLVLSTTAAESVLLKTAESFAPLRPNRVILTKLDEAVNFGVIVNVARRLSTQLSFVTTGQEVPDDIELGQPDRLARLVLDNGMATQQPASQPVAFARERRAETVSAGA